MYKPSVSLTRNTTVNASTFARVRALAEEGNKAAAVKLATDEHAERLMLLHRNTKTAKAILKHSWIQLLMAQKELLMP